MSNPTKSDKQYWNALAETIGCIACRIDGHHNPVVSIHHCDGRTKPGAHRKVLPLCAEHHQTGGQDAPSIHPWKARFEAKYGTQEYLMDKCNELLKSASCKFERMF
jgi:hypothetical protein